MKILVAFASKYGSTKGIAEYIGEKFKERGLQADVMDVSDAKDLTGYDAFVVGSAAFMGHWMKQAKKFVIKNRNILSTHPLWLFSSGPVGKDKVDAKGRDIIEASKPLEFDELQALIKPRGKKIFFGALYGDRLTGMIGFGFRMAKKMKSARDNMPEGDFRDWKDIETWTNSIAEEIKTIKV